MSKKKQSPQGKSQGMHAKGSGTKAQSAKNWPALQRRPPRQPGR